MVSPDGTRPEVNRPEVGRTALFAGAALLIAVGFVVLGSLTAPDEPIAAETTTSSTSTTVAEIMPPIDLDDFTVGQIATGQPLEWARVEADLIGYPLGLTEHDGAVYSFASLTSRFQPTAGGLTGWRSADGTTWESLGQVVGDDYRVTMVESTEHGLVAVGTSADGSTLMVWTSHDGERWTPNEFSDESDYPSRYYPMAIGANDGVLVIATNFDLDRQTLLEEALHDAAIDLDLSYLGWSTDWRGESGHWLTVDGPLGIRALEIPLDDLDLTPRETQWIVEGHSNTQTAGLWVNRAGEDGWRLISMDGFEWIESIVTRADGTMILVGSGPAGRISRQTGDGILWTDYDADREPRVMHRWGSRLVGILDFSRPELLVSDDGVSWDSMGPADRFPLPIQWHVGALGSGDDGVALSVIGYDPSPRFEEPAVTGEIDTSEIVTSEGHVLTLNLEERRLALTVGDTTHTWKIFGPDPAPGVEVDTFERIVTFSDPHTGERLTELTFQELTEAEHAYYTERFQPDEHKALVFTEDGSRWVIQSAADAVGESTWIPLLEVAGGHVYAAVLEPATVYNLYAEPGFELWVAEIP